MFNGLSIESLKNVIAGGLASVKTLPLHFNKNYYSELSNFTGIYEEVLKETLSDEQCYRLVKEYYKNDLKAEKGEIE